MVRRFGPRKVHKLINPLTGLFWDGSFRGSMFDEAGIEYSSLKTCGDAYREYEITRVSGHNVLPELEVVTYQMEYKEEWRGKIDFSEDDLRLTRFAFHQGKTSRLQSFIRALHQESKLTEYPFIVDRGNSGFPDDSSGIASAIVSSRKSTHRFIAVKSDADLLYLRLALGDRYITTYDTATGKKYELESG